MIHSNTKLAWISNDMGLGVVADAFIPKGTIVWVLDALDQTFDPDTFRALPALLQEKLKHFEYMSESGEHILCWDNARYMNHSCSPATRSLGQSFEVARRDIQPGEQLTCDYGALYLRAPLQCHCGEAQCRGVIQASDYEEFKAEWKAEADRLFDYALAVDQPLLKYCATHPADLERLQQLDKQAGGT